MFSILSVPTTRENSHDSRASYAVFGIAGLFLVFLRAFAGDPSAHLIVRKKVQA
ncbi:MAG: hypothetical protein ACOYNN_06200 [Terrimicrobiaceae bacterium]